VLVNKHKHKLAPIVDELNLKRKCETKVWLPANWSLHFSLFYFNPYLSESWEDNKEDQIPSISQTLSLFLSRKQLHISINTGALALALQVQTIFIVLFHTSHHSLATFALLSDTFFLFKSERYVSPQQFSHTFHSLILFLIMFWELPRGPTWIS
jgi:hypothetical protein